MNIHTFVKHLSQHCSIHYMFRRKLLSDRGMDTNNVCLCYLILLTTVCILILSLNSFKTTIINRSFVLKVLLRESSDSGIEGRLIDNLLAGTHLQLVEHDAEI